MNYSEALKAEAWNKLQGDDYLKRILEITIKGNLSLTVIGNPDNGKKFLEILTNDTIIFLKPCLCGNYMDKYKSCSCESSEIRKYQNNCSDYLYADILYHYHTPSIDLYYQLKQYESYKEMINRPIILDQKIILDWNKNKQGINDMFIAYRQKYHPTLHQIERLKKVTEIIARLDQNEIIKVQYLTEAIQYQIVDCLLI